MDHFTPWSALGGGVLIGTAAALLLWLNGRIAGISGIVNGLLQPGRGDTAWRAQFVLGLIAGAAVYALVYPAGYSARAGFPAGLLALGGFLVGFGTRLGGGCTSGHGVCGIARLAPRSLAATITFVLTGAATVFIVRHVLGAGG